MDVLKVRRVVCDAMVFKFVVAFLNGVVLDRRWIGGCVSLDFVVIRGRA